MNHLLVVLLLSLSLFSKESLAHHSRAEFSGDDIEIEGELTAVIWRNPHPTFRVRLSDAGQSEIEVQVYGAIGTLSDTGVSQSLFNVGDRITLAGRFSSRRSNLFLGTHAMLSNGLEAVLQYDAEPRWSGERVGGLGMETTPDQAVLTRAAAANKGLFRVWSRGPITEAAAAIRAMDPKYTEAAVAARETWDPNENPITRCEPLWMPTIMWRPAPVREFVDNGDRILLNVAVRGGAARTIYLGEVPESVGRSPTRLGISTGQWEGDTLVVETHMIDAPAFDGQGTIQSSEMQVVERFTVSEDQARLDYEAIMTDPIAFEAPVVFRYEYLALDEEFPIGNCAPDDR